MAHHFHVASIPVELKTWKTAQGSGCNSFADKCKSISEDKLIPQGKESLN